MSQDELYLDIEKQAGAFRLSVSDVIPLEGVTAIFGPSGSGKSTLLRLIAGLDAPDRGTIRFGSAIWVDTSIRKFRKAHQRAAGIVQQGGHLLPHKNVLQNLIYADKRARRISGERFEEVMEMLEIEPLVDRKPVTLSGGERQRVALAQGLLSRPALLLLDEPLSALDLRRKRRLIPYLDRLSREYALPMLYVSHDLQEVAQLADRTLYLENGDQKDFGPTVDVLNRHGFVGADDERTGLILSGRIGQADHKRQLMEVSIDQSQIYLPLTANWQQGQAVRIIIRAADIALSVKQPDGLSIRNALPGTITRIHAPQDQAMADIGVDIGQAELPVRITRAAAEELDLREGSPIYALVKTAVLAG